MQTQLWPGVRADARADELPGAPCSRSASGEHDRRRLAAQLEHARPDQRAADLADAPADRGGAGEADHVDVGVADEVLGRLRGRAATMLMTPGGKPASVIRSPIAKIASGFGSGTLTTTVQPATSAGPAFWATHGEREVVGAQDGDDADRLLARRGSCRRTGRCRHRPPPASGERSDVADLAERDTARRPAA